MRKLLTGLTLLLAIGAPLTNSVAETSNPVLLNQIAAFVNEEVITASDLSQAVQQFEQMLQQRGQSPMPPQSVLKKQALQRLIYDKLQLQLAKQVGFTVTPKEIKAMRAKLEKLGQADGVSDATIKKRLLIGKIQRSQVATQVHLTKEEVISYQRTLTQQQSLNNRYHLEDILVPLPEKPSHAQRRQARKLAFKVAHVLKKGSTLSEAIATLGLKTEQLRNQDLGWRDGHTLPTLFIRALQNKSKGDLVGPLKAGNGYHTLKLVDLEIKATPVTKAQAQELLFQKRFLVQLKKFLARLKSKAYIKINTSHEPA